MEGFLLLLLIRFLSANCLIFTSETRPEKVWPGEIGRDLIKKLKWPRLTRETHL